MQSQNCRRKKTHPTETKRRCNRDVYVGIVIPRNKTHSCFRSCLVISFRTRDFFYMVRHLRTSRSRRFFTAVAAYAVWKNRTMHRAPRQIFPKCPRPRQTACQGDRPRKGLWNMRFEAARDGRLNFCKWSRGHIVT